MIKLRVTYGKNKIGIDYIDIAINEYTGKVINELIRDGYEILNIVRVRVN